LPAFGLIPHEDLSIIKSRLQAALFWRLHSGQTFGSRAHLIDLMRPRYPQKTVHHVAINVDALPQGLKIMIGY
jgi:hypothetical protein